MQAGREDSSRSEGAVSGCVMKLLSSLRWSRLARAGIVAALACLWQGCVSQMVCNDAGVCVETGGAGEAAVTAAAAGALWVANDGCATAGCRPPLVCNTASGFCEYAHCGESTLACPPGTHCDSNTWTCR
jgi:hypothetical protein